MLPPPPQEPRALSGRARPAATGNRTRGSARLRTLPLQLTGQCQPPREEEDHGGYCLHPQASPPPCHPPAEPTSPRSQQEGRAPTHTAENTAAGQPDNLHLEQHPQKLPLKNGENREERAFQTNVPGSLREGRRVAEGDPPESCQPRAWLRNAHGKREETSLAAQWSRLCAPDGGWGGHV